MQRIAGLIDRAITSAADEAALETVKAQVAELVAAFPLYPERRAEYSALEGA
jgi:glycine/serine hydroxymethyltransferase